MARNGGKMVESAGEGRPAGSEGSEEMARRRLGQRHSEGVARTHLETLQRERPGGGRASWPATGHGRGQHPAEAPSPQPSRLALLNRLSNEEASSTRNPPPERPSHEHEYWMHGERKTVGPCQCSNPPLPSGAPQLSHDLLDFGGSLSLGENVAPSQMMGEAAEPIVPPPTGNGRAWHYQSGFAPLSGSEPNSTRGPPAYARGGFTGAWERAEEAKRQARMEKRRRRESDGCSLM